MDYDSTYISSLTHWLRFDSWTPDQAFYLFCEAIPDRDSFVPIGDSGFFIEDEEEVVLKRRQRFQWQAKRKHNKLWDIWRSGWNINLHENEHNPPSYYIDWAVKKGIEIPWLQLAVDKGLINREESARTTYSTPLISVLVATIAEFFEPRRDRDAKKEEVVEWVKRKAAEAGEIPSDNVAEAIFTIIKPKDHAPRKRRG